MAIIAAFLLSACNGSTPVQDQDNVRYLGAHRIYCEDGWILTDTPDGRKGRPAHQFAQHLVNELKERKDLLNEMMFMLTIVDYPGSGILDFVFVPYFRMQNKMLDLINWAAQCSLSDIVTYFIVPERKA